MNRRVHIIARKARAGITNLRLSAAPARAVLLAVVLMLGACGDWRDYETHHALMVQAHTLGQDDRWGEVTPLAREILLQEPHHPIGHFLLGTSLLRVASPALQVADGELLLALHLFTTLDVEAQQALLRPLESIYTPETFTATIYTELARLHLRIIHQAASYSIPEHILAQHLEKALEYVEAGLALDPESLTLQMMEETIQDSLSNSSQPAPRRPAPPTSADADLAAA